MSPKRNSQSSKSDSQHSNKDTEMSESKSNNQSSSGDYLPPPVCRVASFQGQSVVYNVRANLGTVKRIVKIAAEQGCHLVVFPELWLHGYELVSDDKKQIKDAINKTALTTDDAEMKELSQLAKETQTAICVGYIESDKKHKNKVYNSVVVYDSQGEICIDYRKVHLWGPDEIGNFDKGDTYPVAKIPLREGKEIRVGLNVCYDMEFPEATRVCALQRAQLLLVPTALTSGDWQCPHLILRSRAAENHIFIAYSNHVDKTKDLNGKESQTDLMGCSAVIGPCGGEMIRAACSQSVMKDAPSFKMAFDEAAQNCAKPVHFHAKDLGKGANKKEELLMADINAEAYQGKFDAIDFLRDRRPETFHEIVKVRKNLDNTEHQHEKSVLKSDD